MKTLSIFLLSFFLFLSGCEEELNVKEPGLLVPKTADEDSSVPSIVVNGTVLHSEAYGRPTDPLLVVIHGGPGVDYRSILNFKGLANNGYYVVFYDQRGSGLSKRHSKKEYTIQLFIDDLSAVIDYYKTSSTQKVFLAGHSWGAILATGYINQHPDKVAGAILVDAGGFTYSQVKEFIKKEHSLNLFAEATNDALYFDQFLTGGEGDHAVLDYKLALVSAHDVVKGNELGNAGSYPFWRYGAVVYLAAFEAAEKDGFDFTTNLFQYNTKVLVVYAALNTANSQVWTETISSPFPSTQIERIEGSGHEVVYFGWNEFYPIALNYLNELK